MDGLTYYSDEQRARGFSGELWNDCPWQALQSNPNEGGTWFDDFKEKPTGRYTETVATTGTFALDTTAAGTRGGLAIANSGAVTVAQGINVQIPSTAWVPSDAVRIWFEAYFKFTASSTGPEFFIGLHEVDTSIIAASALSGANMIGFSSVTDNNVILFTSEKATAAANKACTTIVDNTFIALGFKITNLKFAEQYIDGVKQGPTLRHVTANIPIVGLTPSLVCQANGTTQPTVVIDWWRFAWSFR